eukprot:69941-Hanusia_phi.AAC.1
MEVADLQFGAITVCMGLLGTAIGGVLLDTLTRRMGSDVATASLMLVSGLTALAIPFLLAAFLLPSRLMFYVGMIVGELLLFATTSPVNGVFLWCVPPVDRSISMPSSPSLPALLLRKFCPCLPPLHVAPRDLSLFLPSLCQALPLSPSISSIILPFLPPLTDLNFPKAVANILIHVLGDVISPVAAGAAWQ